MSNWNYKLTIAGQDYEFNSIEDDPCRMIMKIDDDSYLIRDVNADVPTERWSLVVRYDRILNGVKTDDIHNNVVYQGRDVDDDVFLDTLIRNILYLRSIYD